jgi:hypothetical protein
MLKNIEGAEKEEDLVVFGKIGKILMEEQAVSLQFREEICDPFLILFKVV